MFRIGPLLQDISLGIGKYSKVQKNPISKLLLVPNTSDAQPILNVY